MRALILAAGTCLAISACNGNEATDNTANTDDNLAAENIVANDTTAIDAATNDAANMAAETQMTLNELADNAAEADNGAAEPANDSGD